MDASASADFWKRIASGFEQIATKACPSYLLTIQLSPEADGERLLRQPPELADVLELWMLEQGLKPCFIWQSTPQDSEGSACPSWFLIGSQDPDNVHWLEIEEFATLAIKRMYPEPLDDDLDWFDNVSDPVSTWLRYLLVQSEGMPGSPDIESGFVKISPPLYPFQLAFEYTKLIPSIARKSVWVSTHEATDAGAEQGQDAEGDTNPPALRPAIWFDNATKSGLNADRLRAATKDGRLQKSEKRKGQGRWRYSISEVGDLWPEYREQIRRQLETESRNLPG